MHQNSAKMLLYVTKHQSHKFVCHQKIKFKREQLHLKLEKPQNTRHLLLVSAVILVSFCTAVHVIRWRQSTFSWHYCSFPRYCWVWWYICSYHYRKRKL